MNTESIAHALNELKELSGYMRRSQPQLISVVVAMRWSVKLDLLIVELERATSVSVGVNQRYAGYNQD